MNPLPLVFNPAGRLRPEVSLRLRLRAATADLHARIDARFSGDFDTDISAYGDFLAALARAVIPLERLLDDARIERLLPDWAIRRRAALLVHDLNVLGRSVPAAVVPPEPGNDAWLLGAAYVLEGSRLGGKVLLRRVLANPDPVARAATHYLQHGATSDLWSTFVERLEASPAAQEAPADAVAGARAAFSMFGGPA